MRYIILFTLSTLITSTIKAADPSPCDPVFNPPKSKRIANYKIKANFDHQTKMVDADQQLQWTNISTDTISEMHFYMYLNAFKNTESTFLKNAGNNLFGMDISQRKAHEWGWIEIDEMIAGGKKLDPSNLYYIQLDDGNPNDQSVLAVRLDQPVLPGETIQLDIHFRAKLPRTIVRSGYSKDNFHLWVHWFPQIGVYEQDAGGNWGWNCHQFFRTTEFYAEFGTYEVDITLDNQFVLGASGCQTSQVANPDGTTTYSYYIEDVIDFAWTAYPYFQQVRDQWEHVDIHLLLPKEHKYLAPRYLKAIKMSLEYLTEHVGEYPFPFITVVDPPLHALNSGMMEYPTFITGGSFYGIPSNVRSLEALVMHEYSHQYFMMMLASNEKEEAWLDEGFVTYFEDRILDHYYGAKQSYYNLVGYRSGNAELSRLEYTGMPNHRIGITASPGWENMSWQKGLYYSKPATMLKSIERLVGQNVMDLIIQSYFETYQFKHPRGSDFIAIALETIESNLGVLKAREIEDFIHQCLYTTAVCDYAVDRINNRPMNPVLGIFGRNSGEHEFRSDQRRNGNIATARLVRHGDFITPVEVRFYFDNGEEVDKLWNGMEYVKEFTFSKSSRLIAVHIDPDQKIYIDIDLNNNSRTLKPQKWGLRKLSMKGVTWVQQILQTTSFLL